LRRAGEKFAQKLNSSDSGNWLWKLLVEARVPLASGAEFKIKAMARAVFGQGFCS
jgi:hypothetical protein